LRQEAGILGRDDEFSYLRFAHQLDRSLELANQMEGTRQQQDAAEQDRRTGARHRRPTDEVMLATAMRRLEANTYLYGQTADLAGGWDGADPFADSQFGTSTATPEDVRRELAYQVSGGLPPARARRQPGLAPVQRLSRRLGLVP
jgi:hypothetical protein